MRILQPPELDTDTLSVIEAARAGHEPNEMARARVRRGVEIKLAAGIALAIGPATSAFAGALKVTAAVVAVGSVVGAGVYVAPRYLSKPAPVHAPAPRVAAHPAPAFIPEASPPDAPPAEIAVPERVATAPRAPSKRRVAAAPAPAPVENASSLKEEIALLGAANAALGRGDFKRALSLLDDYDRRSGAGLLSQERMVTGILAACGAGRVNTAREDARQFRARWPRSPLASRVDGSCAGAADPARPTP